MVREAMHYLSAISKRGIKTGWLASLPFPLNDGTCGFNNARGSTRYAVDPWDTTGQFKQPNGSFCPPRPHPGIFGQARCPPTDWRLPHVLSALNIVASEEAARKKVDYLDLWTPAFHLQEISSDGAHYAQRPIIGILAHVIWRWLAAGADNARPHHANGI
eukprot:7066826-Prymnesium_polylepis.1